MKYGTSYSFLNMSHMLNQCINFTNQILNVNYYKSLGSRCNLIGNKIASASTAVKKNEQQIPFDILRVTSLQ